MTPTNSSEKCVCLCYRFHAFLVYSITVHASGATSGITTHRSVFTNLRATLNTSTISYRILDVKTWIMSHTLLICAHFYLMCPCGLLLCVFPLTDQAIRGQRFPADKSTVICWWTMSVNSTKLSLSRHRRSSRQPWRLTWPQTWDAHPMLM